MEVTTQLLTETNLQEKFQDTYDLYESRHREGNSSPDEAYARFHFQAALAAHHLNNRSASAPERMRRCRDFNGDTIGDLLRDEAVKLLSQGKFDEAEFALVDAYECRIDDIPDLKSYPADLQFPEQHWSDQVVYGRIFEAEGRLQDAFETLKMVLIELTELQRTTELRRTYERVAPHRKEAAFHMLRVAVKLNNHVFRDKCYRIILENRPSPRQLAVASALRWGGTTGVRIVEQLT